MKKTITILLVLTLLLTTISCSDNSKALEDKINELNLKIKTRDKEIEELKAKIKTLGTSNAKDEESKAIKEKDREIEELKKKIKQLEDSKKNDNSSNSYKHNQPLTTAGMVNVEGFIQADTIKNPNILKEVTKESLINKFNWLPEGYKPAKLKLIKSRSGRNIYLEEETANAFEKLRQDALKEGIKFVVFSGYRSYNVQKGLYYNKLKVNKPYAIKSIAYPGSSEHSSGMAMDISYVANFPKDFYNTPQGKFLEKNAHKYGFILRYPEGKQEITNYKYEAWHYRYVGVELATKIKEMGVTLEEYYGTDKFE